MSMHAFLLAMSYDRQPLRLLADTSLPVRAYPRMHTDLPLQLPCLVPLPWAEPPP